MTEQHRYCPRCTRELIERHEGDRPRRACPDQACGYVLWDNPTPVVAAVVEHDGHIVLARNRAWPLPFFGLITGFLEKNEQPELAVLREVEEELSLKGRNPAFIGHYTFERMNQLIIAFHVVASGDIVLGEELVEYHRIAPEKARYWPQATGLALRDWLRSRGHEPQMLDISPHPRTGSSN
jgi:NADH pyrophosphatase NudC (nudix superfamily)